MGISNIVNRIGSINGKLMFESQAGKGIQVKIEVVLKK
jgi:signal transduction histidine kinase